MRVDLGGLRRPQRAQVHRGISRLPALQEALDRWMGRDPLELSHAERAVAAHRVILRADVLERPGHVRREDHVDDVLPRRAGGWRDRVDERDGALERDVHALREEPRLLPELALKRVQEALARLHAAAGQQPDLARTLVVSAQENATPPAQDRRHPHAWMLDAHPVEEPNPRSPRPLAPSSSTSRRRTEATGATTSCAIRVPRVTTNVSRASVFRRTTRISPRYPESMSPGELTTPIPCRAARPERGWTKPAYPSGISTATPVPTSARSPGSRVTSSHAARSRPASPSYAWVGRIASSWRRRIGTSITARRPRARRLRQPGSARTACSPLAAAAL